MTLRALPVSWAFDKRGKEVVLGYVPVEYFGSLEEGFEIRLSLAFISPWYFYFNCHGSFPGFVTVLTLDTVVDLLVFHGK